MQVRIAGTMGLPKLKKTPHSRNATCSISERFARAALRYRFSFLNRLSGIARTTVIISRQIPGT